MYKSIVVKVLGLSMALAYSSHALAGPYGPDDFQDPSSASWGNWSRGDANTVYAEWNAFSSEYSGLMLDLTPDVGSSGGSIYALKENAGSFITSTNNIYSFLNVTDYNLSVAPESGSTITGPVTVALQLNVLGKNLDIGSVRMLLDDGSGGSNPLAFDSSELLRLETVESTSDENGGSEWEYLFLWFLDGEQSSYELAFNASGTSMSLDALSIDIGPSAIAAVPLPAAIWLFGSALFGFLGFTRKRQSIESL